MKPVVKCPYVPIWGIKVFKKALVSCAIAIAIRLAGLSSVQCPEQDGRKRTKTSQHRHQAVPLPWEWSADEECRFYCS